jgi:hypothetical protein
LIFGGIKMSGCDWQKKSFKVFINCKVSQEEWDRIFRKKKRDLPKEKK